MLKTPSGGDPGGNCGGRGGSADAEDVESRIIPGCFLGGVSDIVDDLACICSNGLDVGPGMDALIRRDDIGVEGAAISVD